MMKMLAAVVLGLTLLAEPATVAGTWNLGLQGDHVIPVALVLKQDGKSVTGTIALPTSRTGDRVEVSLSGDFVDNTLKLSGTMDHRPAPTPIALAATLKDDGSLEGTFKGPHGEDMPFTAERLKARK
jgi:hypothetical protein